MDACSLKRHAIEYLVLQVEITCSLSEQAMPEIEARLIEKNQIPCCFCLNKVFTPKYLARRPFQVMKNFQKTKIIRRNL